MKRILATAVALTAMVAATQAYATDFILSNNSANAKYDNFKITYQDATDTSASLSHQVGITTFTDNYFFAPLIAGIGSGAATTNVTAGLTFTLPVGLSITGYALTPAIQAALFTAFSSPDYTAQLAAINLYLSGGPAVVFSQNGTGTALAQQLQAVPLDNANFYKITISGKGTKAGSRYDGNLSSTAVPEPATWAMMLVGFGAVGFAMRRRRKEQVKVRYAF